MPFREVAAMGEPSVPGDWCWREGGEIEVGGVQVGTFEAVHVAEGQIGKADADQWPRRKVPDAGREMLLDDEASRARGEGVRIAAEIRGRARSSDRGRDLECSRFTA